MLDKTYIYKQNHIKIKDYFVNDEKKSVQVITDAKPITVPINELAEFEKACLPIEEPSTAVSIEVVQETSVFLTTLQKTLLENIDKVKADPNYIKQANVVNSSVNALIGMAKVQLQLGRLKSKSSR